MDLDALGKFPILQFFGGLVILVAGAFGILRGVKDKKKDDAAPPVDSADRLHATLEQERLRHDLEEIIRASRQSVFVEIDRVAKEFRELLAARVDADKRDRHDIYGKIQTLTKEFEEDNRKLEHLIRELVAKHDERIRELEIASARRPGAR